MYYNDSPSYLKLDIYNPAWTLRSLKEMTLKVPLESGTFQDSASNVFNLLPSAARNSVVFRDFKTKVRRYLINRANAHLISWFVNILDYFIYLFIYLVWINKWLFYLFNINNNYNNDFITVFPPKGDSSSRKI